MEKLEEFFSRELRGDLQIKKQRMKNHLKIARPSTNEKLRMVFEEHLKTITKLSPSLMKI